MADNTIDLPVAALESEVIDGKDKPVPLRVRLKWQRPEDECLLEFTANADLIKAIHDAKKRGGTVWVRFSVSDRTLTNGTLVVRDILE